METIKMIVMYRECMHNHAATRPTGGYVVDGCCLFEASGSNGTSGALICSACGCHRNFHRRIEVDAPPSESHKAQHEPNPQSGDAIPNLPQHSPQRQEMGPPPGFEKPLPRQPVTTSQSSGMPPEQSNRRSVTVTPRHRQRITTEQKERLARIVERNGWKMFRDYSREEVLSICSRIGITRTTLKNWISILRRRHAVNNVAFI